MEELEFAMEKADALMQQGRYKKSLKILLKWFKEFPSETVIMYNLGIIYYRMNRYGDSIRILKKAIEINVNSEIFNQLGLAYDKSGERKKAHDCYMEAIEIDPEFAPAWNNLGVISFLAGKYKEAYKYFKESLTCDPEKSDTWFNFRDTCIELGLDIEAGEADARYKKYLVN